MSDEEADADRLIVRVREGDRAAFASLVRAVGPSVRRLARALTGRDAEADDVLQETFLAAWKARSTVRDDTRARPWLFTIARHAAGRRAHARRNETLSDDLGALGAAAGWGDDPCDPEDAVARAEADGALWKALDALAPEDREVLSLREVEGLSGEDTAAVLGLSLPAMKSRLHRARLRLLAALRSPEPRGGA